MFNAKARLIADLRARDARRVARIEELEEAQTSWSVNHLAKQLSEKEAAHRETRARLARACDRYRSENAQLTRQIAHLQARLDSATGLDAPGLDLGATWQERRSDKPRPAVKP